MDNKPCVITRSLTGQNEVSYFGYQLSFLPDFLKDHTLLHETAYERLQEVLGRFEQFVLGLRQRRHTAYSLRFICDPEQGKIDVFLLGRILAVAGCSETQAVQLTEALSALLDGNQIRRRQLKGYELEATLSPLPTGFSLVGIRQREDLIHASVAQKHQSNLSDASAMYVIYPFVSASGSYLGPFEMMLHSASRCVFSIYLEPCDVSAQEISFLDRAAYIAKTLAEVSVQTQASTSISHFRDPAADLVGKIYATYRQSLAEPFLLLGQVACSSPETAWTVARSVAASVVTTLEDGVPSQADCVVPRDAMDYDAARWGFEQLFWQPWGETRATQGMERLPYLVGARAACALFRFPINLGAGVPGISVQQMPPDFEAGARFSQPGAGDLVLGRSERGGVVTLPVKDLSRHALITGFTGSGKTNTVVYLLDQLWRKYRIPFLVIESAKQEYRSLLRVPGFEDLLIFTLGNETVSPFRLNPFELMPGVRLETHLGRLRSCFDAALPQFGILPSIVAESLEAVYQACNWNWRDRGKLFADNDPDRRIFPILRDLYREVVQTVERRGYAGDVLLNIRAAAAGRIGSLLSGSSGYMFGGQRSLDPEWFFSHPVILELNDLNETDKALVMMFLLTWLREWRELHPKPGLQHITVVEEAHNVVGNVTSVGASEVAADTAAKSVTAFTNMLAEMRSYGEGIVIADQSPEKLAPDAMRNTNLQIAHQLRDRRDRDAIARAMLMNNQQQEYLAKLQQGQAALFRTGMQQATFFQVPEFKDAAGFAYPPEDEEVRGWMDHHQSKVTGSLAYDGCRFCKAVCRYRDAIELQTRHKEWNGRFLQLVKRFDEPDLDCRQAWQLVVNLCSEVAQSAGYPNCQDAAYCYMVQEVNFPFTLQMREAFNALWKG